MLYDLTDFGNSYCVPNPISPNGSYRRSRWCNHQIAVNLII
nr:MAG TPA: hypothetical protein [Caudoviricetes sp.]